MLPEQVNSPALLLVISKVNSPASDVMISVSAPAAPALLHARASGHAWRSQLLRLRAGEHNLVATFPRLAAGDTCRTFSLDVILRPEATVAREMAQS
ncbi:MAG: hypothetical protein ACK4ZJ_17735, partial [Allorhizobium sp.]